MRHVCFVFRIVISIFVFYGHSGRLADRVHNFTHNSYTYKYMYFIYILYTYILKTRVLRYMKFTNVYHLYENGFKDPYIIFETVKTILLPSRRNVKGVNAPYCPPPIYIHNGISNLEKTVTASSFLWSEADTMRHRHSVLAYTTKVSLHAHKNDLCCIGKQI